VTAANLKQYEADLDARGIPHEWTAQGWNPMDLELRVTPVP
jgi:ribose transport system substrate-binding protein